MFQNYEFLGSNTNKFSIVFIGVWLGSLKYRL